MMIKSDQDIQEVSATQGSSLKKALVESTSIIDNVESQSKTVEPTPLKWWTLALPACAFIFIGTIFFLNAVISPMDELEQPRAETPILLQVSSTSKPSANKLPEKTFVSSIAYNKTNAIAFINDQMVSEGDTVEGFTVLKIQKNSVEFEKDGKQWIQEVGEQFASLQ